MNKAAFYTSVRSSLFGGKITTTQFEGIETITSAFTARCLPDPRWLAYILATTYHETDKKMQPIEEYGKGQGRSYGAKVKRSGYTYETPNKIYYGRGYVQLTWYENYDKMGKILGLPLLEKPELALVPLIAARILVEGMTKGKSSFGDFTGKCLEDYFTQSKSDFIGARKIINGTDKAELIADYAIDFYSGIIVI